MVNRYANSGLSLIELLISVSIVSILMTVGVPAFMELNEERKLRGAAEGAYFFLQQAKSEAITQATDITVDLVQGDSWCLGINDSGSCSCNISSSCTVNGIEMVFNSEDYPEVSMSDLTFGDSDQTSFDGVRGIASGNSGSFILSNSDTEAKVLLSNMGRARICVVSGSLGNYPSC